MAWTKSAWSNLLGSNTTSTVLAPSGTKTGDFDTKGANPYITAAFRVSTLFDTAPNKGLQIDFFGLNSDMADTDPDTLSIFTAEIPQVTTSEEIATYQLNVSALDQMRVSVTNLDSTKSQWVHIAAQGAYPS